MPTYWDDLENLYQNVVRQACPVSSRMAHHEREGTLAPFVTSAGSVQALSLSKDAPRRIALFEDSLFSMPIHGKNNNPRRLHETVFNAG